MVDNTEPKSNDPDMRHPTLNMHSDALTGLIGGDPGDIWDRDQCKALQYCKLEEACLNVGNVLPGKIA